MFGKVRIRITSYRLLRAIHDKIDGQRSIGRFRMIRRRIVFLLGLTTIFVLGGIPTDPLIGSAQVDEPVFPIETIVYICHDGDSEICVIRTDGRGFRQLTNNRTEDFYPSMNSNGQIAYQCGLNQADPSSTYQICSINIDGSDELVLTDSEFSNFTPDINDSGLIAFNCPTTIDERSDPLNPGETIKFAFYGVCVVLADGSGFQQVTVGEASTLVPEGRVNGAQPDINNNGDIVFTCWLVAERSSVTLGLFPHICIISANGENFRTLTGPPTEAEYPSINDAGQVAFSCIPDDDIPVYDRDICVINADGTGFNHLFNDITFDQIRPSISNDGWIAYECLGGARPPDFRNGICVVNFFGSGRRLVDATSGILFNNNEEEPRHPVMLREGVVVYTCPNGNTFEICLLYGDADVRFQITHNDTNDSFPDL